MVLVVINIIFFIWSNIDYVCSPHPHLGFWIESFLSLPREMIQFDCYSNGLKPPTSHPHYPFILMLLDFSDFLGIIQD